jgi:hypothetical protein
MTALNIRKNLSNLLHATANAVDNAKVPEFKGIKNSIDQARYTIAKAVVPNDAMIVVPKNK